jgi:hypothetical protein
MTVMKSARERWQSLTNSTATAPTEAPKTGDLVRFTSATFPEWVGQEGLVLSNNDGSVDYRITKASPGNLEPRWNTVGNISCNHETQLTVITEKHEPAEDVVNHPSHYTQYPVEVIELTRHMPFCDGNVVKYVARSPFKGNRLQDLKKARWYLDDAIAEEEKKLEEAK